MRTIQLAVKTITNSMENTNYIFCLYHYLQSTKEIWQKYGKVTVQLGRSIVFYCLDDYGIAHDIRGSEETLQECLFCFWYFV